MRSLIDRAYSKIDRYGDKQSTAFNIKLPYIFDFLGRTGPATVIDIGCGRGDFAREMLGKGYDVSCVDFSNVCCTEFLSDIEHECVGIIDFSKRKVKFDAAICICVLEHCTEENLGPHIKSIAKISDSVLFGISNHSDRVLNGIELHPIQRDQDWWNKKISKYFKEVKSSAHLVDGRFFFIEAYNKGAEVGKPKREKRKVDE